MEPTPESVKSKPAIAARKRSWGGLIWLLIVAALAGGGWYGYQQWQALLQARAAAQTSEADALRETMAQLRHQAEALARRVDDGEQIQKRSDEQMAALNARVDQTGAALAQLGSTVQGGRERLQLAAVEQLLLMANDRALLAHDAVGAAAALERADERLAAQRDPQLFAIREAIAKERAALLALPRVDVTATALSLSSLMQQLPQLPLRARAAQFETAAQKSEAASEMPTWPLRLWHSLKQALHAVFIIRHNEQGAAKLLPPEQEALVAQLLQLRLEGARLALLRGDTATFRSLCNAAQRWLGQHYRDDDAGVAAARAELGKLAQLELSPQLPDLGGSLKLLRAQLAPAP